jgi:hypothetical protein
MPEPAGRAEGTVDAKSPVQRPPIGRPQPIEKRKEVAMRASLRIHSLTELVLFIGWSLVQNAREHLTSPLALAPSKPTGSALPTTHRHLPLRQAQVWN